MDSAWGIWSATAMQHAAVTPTEPIAAMWPFCTPWSQPHVGARWSSFSWKLKNICGVQYFWVPSHSWPLAGNILSKQKLFYEHQSVWAFMMICACPCFCRCCTLRTMLPQECHGKYQLMRHCHHRCCYMVGHPNENVMRRWWWWWVRHFACTTLLARSMHRACERHHWSGDDAVRRMWVFIIANKNVKITILRPCDTINWEINDTISSTLPAAAMPVAHN